MSDCQDGLRDDVEVAGDEDATKRNGGGGGDNVTEAAASGVAHCRSAIRSSCKRIARAGCIIA